MFSGLHGIDRWFTWEGRHALVRAMSGVSDAAVDALRALLNSAPCEDWEDDDVVAAILGLRNKVREVGKPEQYAALSDWYGNLFGAVYDSVGPLVDVWAEVAWPQGDPPTVLTLGLRDLLNGCCTARVRAALGNHSVDWNRLALEYQRLPDAAGRPPLDAPQTVGVIDGEWVVADEDAGPLQGARVPLGAVEAAVKAGRGMVSSGRAIVELETGSMYLARRVKSSAPPAGGQDDDVVLQQALARAFGAPLGQAVTPLGQAVAPRTSPGVLEGLQHAVAAGTQGARADGAPAPGLARNALEAYGYRTGSALKPGHRRVAAEVLRAIGSRADSARAYLAVEHARQLGTARYAEMDVLAAQVDTLLEAHRRAGATQAAVDGDDCLEIACSRLGALDLIERDGNVSGALALQGVATEGYLFSVSSRDVAAKHAKEEAKLRDALGERGSAGGRGKGGDKGGELVSQGRPGVTCYLCSGPHAVTHCPNLAAARAAVRQ